eukprot:superscaffoldBa00006486_g21584
MGNLFPSACSDTRLLIRMLHVSDTLPGNHKGDLSDKILFICRPSSRRSDTLGCCTDTERKKISVCTRRDIQATGPRLSALAAIFGPSLRKPLFQIKSQHGTAFLSWCWLLGVR